MGEQNIFEKIGSYAVGLPITIGFFALMIILKVSVGLKLWEWFGGMYDFNIGKVEMTGIVLAVGLLSPVDTSTNKEESLVAKLKNLFWIIVNPVVVLVMGYIMKIIVGL